MVIMSTGNLKFVTFICHFLVYLSLRLSLLHYTQVLGGESNLFA